jgi:hypothetical protein
VIHCLQKVLDNVCFMIQNIFVDLKCDDRISFSLEMLFKVSGDHSG